MLENLSGRVNTLRIIMCALIGGVVVFAVIAVALVKGGVMKPTTEIGGTLMIALAAIGIGELPAFIVIRQALIRKLTRSIGSPNGPSNDETIRIYVTLTNIAGALAEGFALFGIVVYLVGGQPLALAATVIGLVIMVANFPTADKANRFVNRAPEATE